MSQSAIHPPGTAWRPPDTLATRVLLVRLNLRESQRAFALRTGLTYGEVQSMENGAAVRDEVRKLKAISTTTGADIDWLMWGGPLDADSTPPDNTPAGITNRDYPSVPGLRRLPRKSHLVPLTSQETPADIAA